MVELEIFSQEVSQLDFYLYLFFYFYLFIFFSFEKNCKFIELLRKTKLLERTRMHQSTDCLTKVKFIDQFIRQYLRISAKSMLCDVLELKLHLVSHETDILVHEIV